MKDGAERFSNRRNEQDGRRKHNVVMNSVCHVTMASAHCRELHAVKSDAECGQSARLQPAYRPPNLRRLTILAASCP